MNNHDDELDHELKKRLGDVDIPPPTEQAKRRAIAMARARFEAAQRDARLPAEISSKGLPGWLRLIVGSQPDDRRVIMPFNRKLIYTGLTTAALAAVAVGITLQYRPAADLRDTGQSEEAILAGRSTASPAPGESAAPHRATDSGAARPESGPGPRLDRLELADQLSDQPASVALEAMPGSRAPGRGVAGMAKVQPAPSVDGDLAPGPYYRDVGRDRFEEFEQSRVKLVSEEPVSTFSADVDTASYSFVRRMLNSGVLPQGDAVRVEEMVNYFDYDYPLPATREQPFRPTVVVSDSPWAKGRKLMHIGIKGYDLTPAEKPRSNLVFLLDVSGSMNSPDKLPLVKHSMELLLTTLNPQDTVAIAVYAGAAGTVLEPTPVREKQKILDALRQLQAGGSTAGAQGIRLAYELARARFDENAVNRVILATDGDFNVGITSQRELQGFVERQREEGIFLSVLGFGQGNYQDALMQALAQNGNGVAAYIDTLSEAQKVLVDEATSTLFPIARDVKLQVEFNPATVAEYRLIGYETRHLNREDFNNDAVDAGDIGAGHTVTAIYEFTPVDSDARQIEASRYARRMPQQAGNGDEYAFLKIRYKLPDEDKSKLITHPIASDNTIALGGQGLGREAGFATAVAGFAQLLKGGRYTGNYSYDDVIELAQQTRGDDPYGYRTEFIQLVRKARTASAMQAR